MKDKYILDSSIWIEIERNNEKICGRVLPLIQKNKVCLVDVIVAEVLRGVKTNKDFVTLKDAFSCYTQLSVAWDDVAELAFKLARHGQQPPLLDVYIACATLQNHKIIVTQDKHFSKIANVVPLQYELLR
ncbi:MAG: hypothetical protein ACD_62C00560G0006 [uncultured bacterium]|nr:MAG: hypothetical protein ACD_62C00560G0006 [uncultured bacterium]HLD44133.1 PIN domain-containing protein [bacterium]